MESIVFNTLDKIEAAGKEFLAAQKGKKHFAFYGDMGAGKTTFIKTVCRLLQVTDVVTSPTFSIINEYQTLGNDKVFHFDFYRINKIEEVMDIGYEDYLYSGNYCLMEWPEKIEKLLPENIVYVTIQNLDDRSRSIHVKKK